MNLMFFLMKEKKKLKEVPEPVQYLHRSSAGATEVQFNKKRDVCFCVCVSICQTSISQFSSNLLLLLLFLSLFRPLCCSLTVIQL